MCFCQGSHASSSTPQGRSLVVSLGGAAAPKFLKNWLTFAHSPYDPDHKSASGGPPRVCVETIFNVLIFLRSHENMGIILNKDKEFKHMKKINRKQNKEVIRLTAQILSILLHYLA